MNETVDSATFETLMLAYHEAAGIAALQPGGVVHHIRIDDVPIVVSLQAHADGPSVFIVAHFDAMPTENAGPLLSAMLANNFLLQAVGAPMVWGINPVTGQTVATSHVLLHDLNAPTLGARLEVLVQSALEMLREMTLQDDEA